MTDSWTAPPGSMPYDDDRTDYAHLPTLEEVARQRSGPISKGEPRCVTKKRMEKIEAKNERACREITRKRDLGKCRVPGCIDRALHLHHIEYRSASSRRKWHTSNCVWLCVDHHRLEHAGEITIRGNADLEIEVTGNLDLLKFRL